jgi:hypothetical protein
MQAEGVDPEQIQRVVNRLVRDGEEPQ